jgi:hypothetical protein
MCAHTSTAPTAPRRRTTRLRARARFQPHPGQRAVLLAAMLLALAGCREFMAEPAPAGSTLAIAFHQAVAMQTTESPCPLPQPAGGLARVFDRADSIRVRLTGSSTGAFSAVAGLRRSDGDGWISIFVDDLQGSRETRQLTVDLLLRVGGDRRQAVLFRDSIGVELQRGAVTRVDLTPRAIADDVRISTLGAPAAVLGDTVQLCGVVLFASGDTIPGVLPVWRTLDPEIVAISSTGRMVTLAEGEARVVGEYELSADTVSVRVTAIPVSLSITPARDTIDVEDRRSLRGELRDARGNELGGRVPRWSSSNPAVATVSPDAGIVTEVTAVASGSAIITAVFEDGGIGPLSATAEIIVRTAQPPPAPIVVTTAATGVTERAAVLRGTVNPSGVAARAWFEWGSTPDLGSTTPEQALGSGTDALPISAALVDLAPGTLYYFRAVGSSAGGTVRGGTLQFRTDEGRVPPPYGLTARATATTLGMSVELTWDYGAESPDSFLVYYRYERGDSIDRVWSLVRTEPGSARSWHDNNLDPLAIHHYRMRAAIGDRVSEFSDSVSARLDFPGGRSAVPAERHVRTEGPNAGPVRWTPLRGATSTSSIRSARPATVPGESAGRRVDAPSSPFR